MAATTLGLDIPNSSQDYARWTPGDCVHPVRRVEGGTEPGRSVSLSSEGRPGARTATSARRRSGQTRRSRRRPTRVGCRRRRGTPTVASDDEDRSTDPVGVIGCELRCVASGRARRPGPGDGCEPVTPRTLAALRARSGPTGHPDAGFRKPVGPLPSVVASSSCFGERLPDRRRSGSPHAPAEQFPKSAVDMRAGTNRKFRTRRVRARPRSTRRGLDAVSRRLPLKPLALQT